MATVIAQTILDGAARKSGMHSPSTQDRTDWLSGLNDLLGMWSVEGLLVPYLTTENFTLNTTNISYSIGLAGDFDTVRPIEIVNAYLQDSNGYDYPLDVRNMSKERYNAITDKTSQARPERLLYVQSYPLGKIYFDYVPDEAYTFYMDSFKPLTELASISTTVNMPDEYKMALTYNLALLIAEENDIELSKTVLGLAMQTKKVLKRNNIQAPLAKFDRALIGGGAFNIYTGQSS